MPTQQEGRVTSRGVGAEGRGDLAPRDSSTFSASLRDKIWRLPGYHPKKRREEESTNFLREHGYGISEYEKVNHYMFIPAALARHMMRVYCRVLCVLDRLLKVLYVTLLMI